MKETQILRAVADSWTANLEYMVQPLLIGGTFSTIEDWLNTKASDSQIAILNKFRTQLTIVSEVGAPGDLYSQIFGLVLVATSGTVTLGPYDGSVPLSFESALDAAIDNEYAYQTLTLSARPSTIIKDDSDQVIVAYSLNASYKRPKGVMEVMVSDEHQDEPESRTYICAVCLRSIANADQMRFEGYVDLSYNLMNKSIKLAGGTL